MKTIRTLVLTALTLSACSAMSAAAFIKFDGVPGESKDASHKEWIDISSVAGIMSPRDVATGQASGRRQHEPITIRKQYDKASPVLAKAMADKRAIPSVTVSKDGTHYTLSNVMITSIQKEGATEVVSFNYTKIEMAQAQAQAAVRQAGPERAQKAQKQ